MGARSKTAAHYAHVDRVTYWGRAPLTVDIVDCQVQGGFVTIGDVLPHTKSGCVKPLGAFGTGPIALEPQISTFTAHRFKG